MAFRALAQVVVMKAQNLEAANPDLLPAAQVELRAIHAGITMSVLRMKSCPHPRTRARHTLSADEEIAFQKTTVHPESNNPVWEQQFTLPVPNANESQLEITLWYMQRSAQFTSSSPHDANPSASHAPAHAIQGPRRGC